MTDCGAVNNMLGPPANAPDAAHAAAWTINNGTDVEAGSTVWTQNMAQAVQQGLVTEDRVNESVRRTVLQHMAAGRFDPPESVSWTSISTDVLNSTEHQKMNYDIASQGIVLLKNDGVLPIKAGSKVAVVGPQAMAQFGLTSDYIGDQQCYNGGQLGDNDDCILTIAGSIARTNVGGATMTAPGVDINSNDTSKIAAAVALAKDADVVVLALGIDRSIEHEGQDRVNITLPGLQEPFAQQVLALGKPTVLVLTNGGALAIDTLMTGPNAIVEAFNPNTIGAAPLAHQLFGVINRWGKLPITIYPADIINQLDMADFNMSKPPGRTYRYYTGKALFAFGSGLSLTTFTHTCAQSGAEVPPGGDPSFTFDCTVANTGSMGGDEVLQVYHLAGADIRAKVDHPVPIKQLVDFERVTVPAGGTSERIQFVLSTDALRLTNNDGDRVVYSGTHTFLFSRGNGKDQSFTVTV